MYYLYVYFVFARVSLFVDANKIKAKLKKKY